MALPDYFKYELGTAVIWGEAGASGVTNTLSLDALADGAARMGAGVDLGAAWDQEYLAGLVVETGTAPTAGTTAVLYFAWSYNNTLWPGTVTGSDASYSNPSTASKLLGLPSVILVATNSTNTVLVQQFEIVIPRGRYVAPVVYNLLGQAFRDEATATNNDSRVYLIPRRALVQESA